MQQKKSPFKNTMWNMMDVTCLPNENLPKSKFWLFCFYCLLPLLCFNDNNVTTHLQLNKTLDWCCDCSGNCNIDQVFYSTEVSASALTICNIHAYSKPNRRLITFYRTNLHLLLKEPVEKDMKIKRDLQVYQKQQKVQHATITFFSIDIALVPSLIHMLTVLVFAVWWEKMNVIILELWFFLKHSGLRSSSGMNEGMQAWCLFIHQTHNSCVQHCSDPKKATLEVQNELKLQNSLH